MSGPARKSGGVHASVVAIGETGVLIVGASGAGKSRLALALIAEASRRGDFARLVGDDRMLIAAANGRVLARPHPAIAGLIEERGAGLHRIDHEPVARVTCCVSLVAAGHDRLPEPATERHEAAGVSLPRLTLQESVGPDEGARRVLAFLERLGG